jgi:phosphoadenosine phosphosulfate reductase
VRDLNWDSTSAAEAGRRLEDRDAVHVLSWALDGFAPERLALATSFGAEDCALIDVCAELGRFPRLITLDTGRLPAETYAVMDELRRKYGVKIELFFPDAADVEGMTTAFGPNLFYETVERRMLCCEVRKMRPLRRALAGCDAWITGLRREQSADRASVSKVEWDERFGLVKINPLADWSDQHVWQRLRRRGVPYNKLHDKGYPSIGCAPCTRAVLPGADPRSGRWWWEDLAKKECGLHLKS